MTDSSNLLDTLISAAYNGPVFGPDVSFGPQASYKLPAVKEQIKAIAEIFNHRLYTYIKVSYPGLDASAIKRLLQEIGPKAICFCPALTIGELTGTLNTERLGAAATAIGVMYLADQSMDRGDETVTSAIKLLVQEQITLPEEQIGSWLEVLHHIEKNIMLLALPEDVPTILDCFNEQVLHNEVLLHELSMEYQKTTPKGQPIFLEKQAKYIAKLMVIDAGFPSVTSSLYAIYRHDNPALPNLSKIHNSKSIAALLTVCNAVVRIADEFGDWETDAGHHPKWGIFSINPFNQYHPAIVKELCSFAAIEDHTLIDELQGAFREFHTSPKKQKERGRFIVDSFFDQARIQINNLPQEIKESYSLYITLCMRVLEIGSVNILGDIALADVREQE